jgi:hypothetical protein
VRRPDDHFTAEKRTAAGALTIINTAKNRGIGRSGDLVIQKLKIVFLQPSMRVRLFVFFQQLPAVLAKVCAAA